MFVWSDPACKPRRSLGPVQPFFGPSEIRGRRAFGVQVGVFAALACGGGFAWAGLGRGDGDKPAEETAFAATSIQQAVHALGYAPTQNPQVVLTLPDTAENGAVVPVTVACQLPDVSDIFLVVEQNPNPLVVRFAIAPGTEPYVATRIKMAASSQVHAWVRAGGRVYAAQRHTQVTVGGCG